MESVNSKLYANIIYGVYMWSTVYFENGVAKKRPIDYIKAAEKTSNVGWKRKNLVSILTSLYR